MHEEGGYTELDPLGLHSKLSELRGLDAAQEARSSAVPRTPTPQRRSGSLLQEGLICVAGTRLENTHPPLPCAFRDTHTRQHVYYEFNAI